MEFKVTGLEQLPQLVTNYTELESQIKAKMQEYKSIVVTEDGIQAAKATRAELNKFKTALDNERKRVKSEWDKPLKEFESKVKALIALVDEPIGLIDSQVKAFDNERIEGKKAALLEVYNAEFAGLTEQIPFERVVNPKWANVGQNLEALKAELKGKAATVKSTVKTICKFEDKFRAACLSRYYNTLNVGEALAEYNRLMEIDRQTAQRAAEMPQDEPKIEPAPITREEPKTAQEAPQAAEMRTFDARFINAPIGFINELRDLCHKYGVKYTKVPKGV